MVPRQLDVIDSPRLFPPSLILGGTYLPGLAGGGAPAGDVPGATSAGGCVSPCNSSLS